MPPKTFEWDIEEYEYREKTPDWFWALGITAAALAVVAIIFNNVLFALIVVIGAVTLALFARKQPDDLACTVTERGITVNATLYPWNTLDSFGIDEEPAPKLLLKPRKLLAPLVSIPLHREIVEDVRDTLLDYLDEDEHREPLSQKIMERLGF